MTLIPANLSRVPTLLSGQLLLSSINRTNVDIVRVQQQASSGLRVSTYSDDAVAASAITVLQSRLRLGQRTLQNLSSAQNNLDYLDSAVSDALESVRSAKALASSQIGVTSDAATRNNQAVVVDGIIQSLFQITNRSTNGVYVFGGSTATQPPLQQVAGGFRYVGRGSGLLADLGPARDVPISIGGDNALGETSARLKATRDLNPNLTTQTRLADLAGARSLGIAKGSVSFSFGSGPAASVDLSGADSVSDVITALTAAIRTYETDNSVSILGPGGISVANGNLTIDVLPGGPPNPQLTFSNSASGTTGTDLGLTQTPFSATSAAGADLNPKLTLLSPVSAIPGVTVPLGTIRVRFTSGATSQAIDVDLSGATTIDQVRDKIQTQAPGVRVQINDAGTGIDLFNEVAGPRLSIEPTGTGPDTASELGIRSFTPTTLTTDFNDGAGVRIINNVNDPVTGTPSRAANSDFRITLGNGQAFDVDLRPQDLANVQSILDRINQEFQTAVTQPPVNASAPPLALGQFQASVSASGNGFGLTQTLGGSPGAIQVQTLNNSPAADDLGLVGGTFNSATSTFTAQDRAGVRVNNLFSALIQLRDSLRSDSSPGISLAGSKLDEQIDRLSQTQALVGVYANRVQRASQQQEDASTLDEKVRSSLQDTDYADASLRYNQLRTQLEATIRIGSVANSLTLLDFLK